MSGHSSDMKKIYRLKKYNFKIIEDSCHALGGKYNKYKLALVNIQMYQHLAFIL